MALSSKRVPDWWLAATKHVIGDNSLPDAMVLAFAEIGYKAMLFASERKVIPAPTTYPNDLREQQPPLEPDRHGYFIEIPIDWKCTSCRCPARCACCTPEFCGCTETYHLCPHGEYPFCSECRAGFDSVYYGSHHG